MKIIIEKSDLERIVDDIQHEADMLSLADESTAAEDLSFYVPMIQGDVEDLKRLIETEKPASAEGGGH
ncbi:MAG: hypothetical protein IJQ71_03395 [Clostridia bacterium]|nr:hypothetical protein [Clostridia bacterium]